jgi:hypothetical protein
MDSMKNEEKKFQLTSTTLQVQPDGSINYTVYRTGTKEECENHIFTDAFIDQQRQKTYKSRSVMISPLTNHTFAV